MRFNRRNELTRFDARLVAVVALASAIVGGLADVAPTGGRATDAVLAAGLAALVAWLAATAPWWALVTGSSLALVGSLDGPMILTAVAIAAVGAAGWIGWASSNQPVLRSVIGAATVQVVYRLAWDPVFTSSALLAAGALGVIAITGLLRRQRYVRKRVYWSAAGIGVVAVAATAGLGVGAVRAQGATQAGYDALLDGLDAMQRGDVDDAADALREARERLATADELLAGPLTQPARVVPVVAQNRDTAVGLIAAASDAAAEAADALTIVDLDRLTISNGQVDLPALRELEGPLQELEAAVITLQEHLREADSPWLAAPFQDRLDSIGARADQVAHQARAMAATAAVGPELLGEDEPRRYLLAFVNTAEARGQGGLMGNWSELTVDDGAMTITESGRSADLQAPSLRALQLDTSNDYVTRYGEYGATSGGDGGVLPKFWSNVTMPADMPSAASPMAQMYEQATGRAVDGVFIIDPDGLAAIVDLVGSIWVEDLDTEMSGEELREFLLLDQYEIEEAEREDVLEALTAEAIGTLVTGELPPPQDLAEMLSDAALNGHITAWAADEGEQQFLELVGMDGALPTLTSGMDGLAVVSINASGNKIESFLERTIDYRPVVDQRTGQVTATLTVTLTNTAPTQGYEDYVIGNIVGLPVGTNRTLLDVYTALDVESVHLDGEQLPVRTLSELGYTAYRPLIEIPSGETVVLELELAGNVGPGDYQLAFRPQALPNQDQLSFGATTTGGDDIFEFDGELERRSVLSASGVEAWRPARSQ